jgi:hypothetical protein
MQFIKICFGNSADDAWTVVLQFFYGLLVLESVCRDFSCQKIITNAEYLKVIHGAELLEWIVSCNLIPTQVSVDHQYAALVSL